VQVEGHPTQHLPAGYFFRGPSDMDAVDRTALEAARGRVLDVGAGAGAHSLPLVQAGLDVTAIEILPELVQILRDRGVRARRASVWSFRPRRPFDTVLALMNGTSLAGTMTRLGALLERLRELIASGGQLLIDSTDLETPELQYQLVYEGEKGPPFPQLFVGERVLEREARRSGYAMEVAARAGARYLAILTPRTAGR
jgi:SAM-dependent methyltransferase